MATTMPLPQQQADFYNGQNPRGPFSYIEPHEEAEARTLIDAQFIAMTGKKFGYRVTGFLIACKLYVRPEELKQVPGPDGKPVTIYLPQASQANDKYSSCSGLVIGVGPQAYKGRNADGTDRYPEGPWCKVGDWVALPRYEAFCVSYRGVAIAILPDDKILGVIEDPTDVTTIDTAIRT